MTLCHLPTSSNAGCTGKSLTPRVGSLFPLLHIHEKLFRYSPPENFSVRRLGLAKCNAKSGHLAKKPLDPKIRKRGMAAASGHILPPGKNGNIHQRCFTGTWTLPSCRIPACLGVGIWLDPYRDQGGTATNYANHVHAKIAADNYISKQQTGEQSIVLATVQRWPL